MFNLLQSSNCFARIPVCMTQETEPGVKPWEERLADFLRSAGGILQHPETGEQVILAPAFSPSGENVWNITISGLISQKAQYRLIEGFGLESVAVSPNVIVSAPCINDIYFGRERQVKVVESDLTEDKRTGFREQADKVVSYIENNFSYLRQPTSI